MSDTVTVGAILNTTALELLDSLGNIGSHRAELGVRHETAGAEDLTETANLAHLVRSSHSGVEVELASLDLLGELLGAHDVGASFLGSLSHGAFGEHGNADSLARAVGQGHRAAELLVSLAGVDAETEVDFHGLVELLGGDLLDDLHSLKRGHGLRRNLRDCLAISLGFLSHSLNPFVVLASC